MRNRFLHYLHFTRKERNGTIALLLLCALIFATPEILSRFKSPEGTDFTGFREEIQTFRDSLNSRKSSHHAELFNFNPNTASEEDFVRLGLSQKTAAMICKYRDKGGQFRRPEDFKKIWGLAPEDYERLAPFIRMGNEERDFPEKQFAGHHPAETFIFDPNTATENDFERLGIPKWTIKSILNYRSKGGKFRRKEDFQKIYNLPEEDYARLESFIAIQPSAAFAQTAGYPSAAGFPSKKPATRSVDINRADVEAWMTLPGIGEKR
ncbi:MAG TPA: helix-hairpin-helix domain-containing protein, partial [Saprospiraceae bacterium]|nr:helix-hairpin-helix domain-containing protein [Saprospiraceae bacterium]